MKHNTYETYRFDWRGIEIEIRYCPSWNHTGEVAHIVILTTHGTALPITKIGFLSHFTTPETVEQSGGPVGFIEAWLNEEDDDVDRKRGQKKRK